MKQIDQRLAQLSPGQVIGPAHHRFRLVEQLSPSIMGPRWQADDITTTTSARVTLMFLCHDLTMSHGFLKPFRDLLNRCRKLSGPHIAKCYGTFVSDGLFFSSWEPMEGMSLAELFERKLARKMQDAQKRALVTQVATALDAGYNQLKQPHASLMPEMIYITPESGVKVFGFGWNEVLDLLDSQTRLEKLNLAWQPPEVANGSAISRTTDVYSLGCVLYEIYTGTAISRTSSALPERPPKIFSDAQWDVLSSALSEQRYDRPDEAGILITEFFAEEESEDEESTSDDGNIELGKMGHRGIRGLLASLSPRPLLTTLSQSSAPLQKVIFYLAGLTTGILLMLFYVYHLNNNWRQQLETATRLHQQQQAKIESLQQNQQSAEEQVSNLTNQLQESQQQLQKRRSVKPANVAAVSDDAKVSRDLLDVFHDELAPGVYAPEMIVVPAGRFIMGRISGSGDENETPKHQVSFARPFALSRYEVTFEDYDRFADATGRAKPDDKGWGRGNLPVVNVSWADANAYADWLSQQTGQPYRLPTEAEWEYAARAGTQTRYSWGNQLVPQRANCDGCGSNWDSRQPAPVGSFPANSWGLYDMHGNVSEWVQDCYADNYADTPLDGSAEERSNCTYRVLRGGSFFDMPDLIRAAIRDRNLPDSHQNSWGFRLALDLPDAS